MIYARQRMVKANRLQIGDNITFTMGGTICLDAEPDITEKRVICKTASGIVILDVMPHVYIPVIDFYERDVEGKDKRVSFQDAVAYLRALAHQEAIEVLREALNIDKPPAQEL